MNLKYTCKMQKNDLVSPFEGQFKDKKQEADRGTKFQAKKKPSQASMVNPHTGKRDPKWTAKQAAKDLGFK